MAIDETLNLTDDQRDWFHHTYEEWHAVIRPYAGLAPGGLFRDLPELPLSALEGSKIVPRRDYILADMPKAGRVVEVGTQEGLFAERILKLCQPTELHLIDIDLNPLYARGNRELLERAIIHQGDSSETLASFPDDHFDWLYLDAGHFYSEVKADVEIARRKVKSAGHIIFNDYCLWSSIEFTAYGVPYAAHELALEHGWRVTHLALNKLFYFDIALQKP